MVKLKPLQAMFSNKKRFRSGAPPGKVLVWLVVEPYPSEEYDFVNWDGENPNCMEITWNNMFQITKITIFITINPLLIHHFTTINHYNYNPNHQPVVLCLVIWQSFHIVEAELQ